MRSLALVLLPLAFLSACSSTSDLHFERPWLDDPRMKAWEQLDGWKEAENRDSDEPQMQEFKGCGTMFVWQHALSGGPGWEYLRVAYSFKNTTETKHDWVRVWVEVLDPDGRVVNRTEELLIHPFGYAITPNDTWSNVLKVPTRGVHKRKGWTWRVGCEPVRMKVMPPRRLGE